MSNITKYSTSSAFFGFPDGFFENSENQKFPPTNISVSPCKTMVKIEMAVAGFTAEDIEIEEEENRIVVSGHSSLKAGPEGEQWSYEQRGFALRDFKRAWVKKSVFVIESAVHKNGVLTITLIKNAEHVKKIPILTAD